MIIARRLNVNDPRKDSPLKLDTVMKRDARLTGYIRGQTDEVEAPPGFEVNKAWAVCEDRACILHLLGVRANLRRWNISSDEHSPWAVLSFAYFHEFPVYRAPRLHTCNACFPECLRKNQLCQWDRLTHCSLMARLASVI